MLGTVRRQGIYSTGTVIGIHIMWSAVEDLRQETNYEISLHDVSIEQVITIIIQYMGYMK